MQLWERNVFKDVCQSVQVVPHVTLTHDALDLTVQHPPPLPGPLPRHLTVDPHPQTLDLGSHLPLTYCGQQWRPVQTCSRPTVCKRPVRIQLKCFLLFFNQFKKEILKCLDIFLLLNTASFHFTSILIS